MLEAKPSEDSLREISFTIIDKPEDPLKSGRQKLKTRVTHF